MDASKWRFFTKRQDYRKDLLTVNDKTKQYPSGGKRDNYTDRPRPAGESRKDKGSIDRHSGCEGLIISNTFSPPDPLPTKGDNNGDNK